MTRTRTPYTINEDELIGTMFMLDKTDAEIVAELRATLGTNRSVYSVNARRYKLGLITPNRPQAVARNTARERSEVKRDLVLDGDRRFKTAMLAAIKSGAEDAIIGVIKDRRPFAPGTYQAPEPDRSLCGSAASMCASA